MSTRTKLIRGGAVVASGLLLFAAVIALVPTGATATHQPADKVVAAGSTLVVAGPNAEYTILTSTLRTSKPTDLILAVSMECSILTDLITGGEGSTDSAMASGHIRAWVEIDGQVVPVNSTSEPPQLTPPGGSEDDKVTFCNRAYGRTVEDAELLADGTDVESDYIHTKNANAFNWLRLNLGAGVHSIVVKATLLQETAGDATAQAVIGNRSLIVEPAKLANDATI